MFLQVAGADTKVTLEADGATFVLVKVEERHDQDIAMVQDLQDQYYNPQDLIPRTRLLGPEQGPLGSAWLFPGSKGSLSLYYDPDGDTLDPESDEFKYQGFNFRTQRMCGIFLVWAVVRICFFV